jgi:hypothetical protein
MRDPDDILDLTELAKELQLAPRTVKRVASHLGDKCFGNRWRFCWGTVMERVSNAYPAKESGKSVDGQNQHQWQASSDPDVCSRPKKEMEWTAARQWEVEKKAAIKTLLQQELTLPCALKQLGLKTDLLPEETTSVPQTPTVSDGLMLGGISTCTM